MNSNFTKHSFAKAIEKINGFLLVKYLDQTLRLVLGRDVPLKRLLSIKNSRLSRPHDKVLTGPYGKHIYFL